jgi:hypothetical protein
MSPSFGARLNPPPHYQILMLVSFHPDSSLTPGNYSALNSDEPCRRPVNGGPTLIWGPWVYAPGPPPFPFKIKSKKLDYNNFTD